MRTFMMGRRLITQIAFSLLASFGIHGLSNVNADCQLRLHINHETSRRRKNQRMTQVKMFIHFRLTQHVSGIIMPVVRRQT